ncbi:MAG: TPM domain-containing protein [Firmicutes bacterium]|nr:TPM domain-containing protein [Bacillota bacterium]
MRKDHIINSIRILAVCCAVFLLAAFVRPVRAQANPSQRFVYDQAGVLSESEAAKLEKYAHKIGTDHGLDIIIVFYDQGYTPDQLRDAADDLYDQNGFGYEEAHGSGIVFAVDITSRQYWYSTSGTVQQWYTESLFTELDSKVRSRLSANDWYNSAREFIRFQKKFQNPSVPVTLGMRVSNAAERLPLIGLISAAFSGILTFFRSKTSHSANRPGAGAYVRPGSYRLLQADDVLVNEHTTRTRISTGDFRGPGGGHTGGVFIGNGGSHFNGNIFGGHHGGGMGVGGHFSGGGHSHGGHGGSF